MRGGHRPAGERRGGRTLGAVARAGPPVNARTDTPRVPSRTSSCAGACQDLPHANGAQAREAAMVLIVIDTQTDARRIVMVPVKAGSSSGEPARILAYAPRS